MVMASHQSIEPPHSPWLAITFGCCASKDLREDEVGLRREVTEMQICYDQPRIVPPPRAEPEFSRPLTSHSMSRHISQWASRASVRTSSFSTLSRPWTTHTKGRPSIGAPTDFRKMEVLNSMAEEEPMPTPVRRRRSFRPLELSIYMPEGRLSPLPDFSQSEWTKLPADLEVPAQALVRQSTTTSLSSNRSSYAIQRKPVGSSTRSSVRSSISRPPSVLLANLEEPRAEYAPNTSVQRSNTQSSSLTSPVIRSKISRVPSPSRARSNTAPELVHARRGSLRRAKTDVDEAIRELNTIVEETRRADALRTLNPSPAFSNRPPPSPSHHIPAIAPSLRMHVRSETLSDIGSAFSVPVGSKALPGTPPTLSEGEIYQPTTHRQTKLRLMPPALPRANTTPVPGPLNMNPITPPTPTVPTPTTPIGRLGAWLKRSLPSTPTTPSFSLKSMMKETPPVPQVPFYQCNPTALPQSRPSTRGTTHSTSRSTAHLRQNSDETATVTLTSYPSTPSLSSRTASPEPYILTSPGSPETPAMESGEAKGPFIRTGEVLRGHGRARGLTINLEKANEMDTGVEGIRVVQPAYENYGGVMVSPSRVGVAF